LNGNPDVVSVTGDEGRIGWRCTSGLVSTQHYNEKAFVWWAIRLRVAYVYRHFQGGMTSCIGRVGSTRIWIQDQIEAINALILSVRAFQLANH
jgi:hypothetical protein